MLGSCTYPQASFGYCSCLMPLIGFTCGENLLSTGFMQWCAQGHEYVPLLKRSFAEFLALEASLSSGDRLLHLTGGSVADS
eukprot:444911-Pelagomonas_calceolata.AAC.1